MPVNIGTVYWNSRTRTLDRLSYDQLKQLEIKEGQRLTFQLDSVGISGLPKVKTYTIEYANSRCSITRSGFRGILAKYFNIGGHLSRALQEQLGGFLATPDQYHAQHRRPQQNAANEKLKGNAPKEELKVNVPITQPDPTTPLIKDAQKKKEYDTFSSATPPQWREAVSQPQIDPPSGITASMAIASPASQPKAQIQSPIAEVPAYQQPTMSELSFIKIEGKIYRLTHLIAPHFLDVALLFGISDRKIESIKKERDLVDQAGKLLREYKNNNPLTWEVLFAVLNEVPAIKAYPQFQGVMKAKGVDDIENRELQLPQDVKKRPACLQEPDSAVTLPKLYLLKDGANRIKLLDTLAPHYKEIGKRLGLEEHVIQRAASNNRGDEQAIMFSIFCRFMENSNQTAGLGIGEFTWEWLLPRLNQIPALRDNAQLLAAARVLNVTLD